jgi:hypothetical protein
MFEVDRHFTDTLQVLHEVVESGLRIDECKFSVFDGLVHLGWLALNLNICQIVLKLLQLRLVRVWQILLAFLLFMTTIDKVHLEVFLSICYLCGEWCELVWF